MNIMRNTILIMIIGLMLYFAPSPAQNMINVIVQDNSYVTNISQVKPMVVDFDRVVLYGTKHYHNGALLYYSYGNIYYYPFFYDNCWYVRAYRYPIIPSNYNRYFRPHRYDYKFHNEYRPHYDWYRHGWTLPSRHRHDHHINHGHHHNSHNDHYRHSSEHKR